MTLRRTPAPSTVTRLLTAVAALVVVACQPAVAPSAPSATSVGSAAPATGSVSPDGTSSAGSPAASSVETAYPSLLRLDLDTDGPFITPGDGPAGFGYALPAAAARDRDGGYVLFIVWFGEEAADILVTVSRSTDGRTWDVGTEPIFNDLGVGVADPGPIPTAAVQLQDGTWLLYGWAAEDDAGSSFSSWRARAAEPEGPWTLDGSQVLEPGGFGTWDSMMAVAASVHLEGDGYRMWYEGEVPGTEVRGEIGLATSPDGLAWQKWNDPATTDPARAASDPVIGSGICGAPTAQAVEQAQVERQRNGYVAVFGGFGAARAEMDLFGAVSPDGRAWHCAGSTPLLRAQDVPNSDGIHTIASLPLEDGRMAVIIESLTGERSELWWATVEVAG